MDRLGPYADDVWIGEGTVRDVELRARRAEVQGEPPTLPGFRRGREGESTCFISALRWVPRYPFLPRHKFAKGRGGSLPCIPDLSRLKQQSTERSLASWRVVVQADVHTYSVRRSLAICGVIVMLPWEMGTDTGGGRRKERYQYIGVVNEGRGSTSVALEISVKPPPTAVVSTFAKRA